MQINYLSLSLSVCAVFKKNATGWNGPMKEHQPDFNRAGKAAYENFEIESGRDMWAKRKLKSPCKYGCGM